MSNIQSQPTYFNSSMKQKPPDLLFSKERCLPSKDNQYKSAHNSLLKGLQTSKSAPAILIKKSKCLETKV